MCFAEGIDSAAALRKADVGLLVDQQGCVVAPVGEVCYDVACDAAVEFVLKKAPVRAAFAGGV